MALKRQVRRYFGSFRGGLIDILYDQPEIGAPLSSRTGEETDYRYLVCGNYNVFYRVEDKTVKIIRVLNARRNFMDILFGKRSETE